MANVLQHPIEFHPRPVNHAPSPFGFGFGLGSPLAPSTSGGWHQATTPGRTNPAAFQQLASATQNSLRAHKRRYDGDDDSEGGRQGYSRDASMDRSPTPERPKRSAPKRARLVPGDQVLKEEGSLRNTKDHELSDNQDIDVGMLLASLPSQSLLPLLNSLLNVQPSLKPLMLQLIPRPSIDTVLEALSQSAKRLREAYPYSSNAPIFSGISQSVPSIPFGFSQKATWQSNMPSSGFGSQSSLNNNNNNNNNMREPYIVSRLQPHIRDFVSACFSYLPYFSQRPEGLQLSQPRNQPKEPPHPSDTFLLLSSITNHILSQPPIGQAPLAAPILPRLLEEWRAWIARIDDMVNREGRMFGREMVQNWERTLDSIAEAKVPAEMATLGELRDAWVSKVGWLVGRRIQQAMVI